MVNENSKVIKMENFYDFDVYIPKEFDDLRANVIESDGKYYLFKYTWDDRIIINELIGSYLAKLIDLEAVDYKIGINNNKKYILSEIFFDNNFDYYYPSYVYNAIDESKLKKKLFINYIPEEYPYIREKLLKLTLLDIKMGQYDRSSYTNIMIKKSIVSNYVDLAPIYDFGLSYPIDLDENLLRVYYNPYVILRKNKDSLSLLIDEYPQVKNYIEILRNIEMPSILTTIENKNNISIDNELKSYLIAKDNEYNKILKKL